jgi:VanZ family protein
MPQSGHRAGVAQVLTALAAAAVLLHLYGLYRPGGPTSPLWFGHLDKLEHLLGFAAPVCLILLARRSVGPGSRLFDAVVLVVFALHAALSEVVQHYLYAGRRTGDPFDVLADVLGTALGWWVAILLAPRVLNGAVTGRTGGNRA